MREPDVLGQKNLYNISPLGEWSLDLLPTSSSDFRAADLVDVKVDLLVAVRAVQAHV